jgi:hypothetical protein
MFLGLTQQIIRRPMVVHRWSGHADIRNLRVHIPVVCVDIVAEGLKREDVLAAHKELVQSQILKKRENCILRTHRAGL